MLNIKKKLLVFFQLFCCCFLFPANQHQSHQVNVFNIEVPVRVFKGNKFIDNLTKNDFELYDNGQKQKIEALYLIRQTSIAKREGSSSTRPKVARHFILFFEVQQFLPKIIEAIDYFFNFVL